MAVDGGKACLAILVALYTLILCFLTIAYFVLFLSSQTSLIYCLNDDPVFESSECHDNFWWSIAQNLSLLGVFAFQHSFQANEKFKNLLWSNGLDVFERMLYNCVSCVSLQMLMYFWKSIPCITIWTISTYDHEVWWWLFTTTHFILWIILFSACLTMDPGELLGIKQVYHYVLDQPLDQRHESLKRLHSHFRHPIFVPSIAIFVFHPVMQIDRLFLSIILISYMILRSEVDTYDYAFQMRQLHRKKRELGVLD